MAIDSVERALVSLQHPLPKSIDPKVQLVGNFAPVPEVSYAVTRPKLKFFRFSSNWNKSPEVEITLPVPTMVHNFAITQNFMVVPDQQVVFKVQEMMKGLSPVKLDRTNKSRFGVLPKYTESASDIVWVESPDTFCFHVWNSWEELETNEVVVIGSCMDAPALILNENSDDHERFKSVLSEIRLNLKTRESTRRPVVWGEDVNLEVGMVNRNMPGRKTRYGFFAIAEPWPKVSGFAKVDLVMGEVKRYNYGDQIKGFSWPLRVRKKMMGI